MPSGKKNSKSRKSSKSSSREIKKKEAPKIQKWGEVEEIILMDWLAGQFVDKPPVKENDLGTISEPYLLPYQKEFAPNRTTRSIQSHLTEMRKKYIVVRNKHLETGSGIMHASRTVEAQILEDCPYFKEAEQIWENKTAPPPYVTPDAPIGPPEQRSISEILNGPVSRVGSDEDESSESEQSSIETTNNSGDSIRHFEDSGSASMSESCASSSESNQSDEDERVPPKKSNPQQKRPLVQAAARLKGAVSESALKNFRKREGESLSQLNEYQTNMISIENKRLKQEKEYMVGKLKLQETKMNSKLLLIQEERLNLKMSIELAKIQLELERERNSRNGVSCPTGNNSSTVDVSHIDFLSNSSQQL